MKCEKLGVAQWRELKGHRSNKKSNKNNNNLSNSQVSLMPQTTTTQVIPRSLAFSQRQKGTNYKIVIIQCIPGRQLKIDLQGLEQQLSWIEFNPKLLLCNHKTNDINSQFATIF